MILELLRKLAVTWEILIEKVPICRECCLCGQKEEIYGDDSVRGLIEAEKVFRGKGWRRPDVFVGDPVCPECVRSKLVWAFVPYKGFGYVPHSMVESGQGFTVLEGRSSDAVAARTAASAENR